LGEVVKCEACDSEVKVQAIQDALYLLGRLLEGGQLFVKISSRHTMGLPIFREAFPNSKWLYMFRDVDTVLQKMMNNRHQRRVCGGYRHIPGKVLNYYLESQHKSLESLQTEEQACAAYLAAHLSMVMEHLNLDGTDGRLVAYEELLSTEGVKDLLDYLGVTVTNWDLVEDQRNKHATRGGEWQPENDKTLVSDKVKSATTEFEVKSATTEFEVSIQDPSQN